MRQATWYLCGGILLAGPLVAADAGPAAAPSQAEPISGWECFQEVPLAPAGSSPWLDFLLTPAVFDASRLDLADVRVYDPSGREVPYALRVYEAKDGQVDVSAREFNRVSADGRQAQVSLDLGENKLEHNEIRVMTAGSGFRRRALLEGSDEGAAWSKIDEKNLLRFTVADKLVEDATIAYSPSRYRYLRVTVQPDPQVDQEAVAIDSVTVRRRVQLPGEFAWQRVQLGSREPVRTPGGPGSAWILDLGGRQVPCTRLRVDVAEREFVRDWHLEAGGPPESKERFHVVARGTWQRRAGEKIEPMVVEIPGDLRAARLRLVVVDNRNPSLGIQSVQAGAPARAIIVARAEVPQGPLTLYFGSPKAAQSPQYDFARNLPEKLEPAPQRLVAGPRQANPVYQPPPLPFTERWPWMIYVLLSAAVLVLAALIVNLARVAIRIHDAGVSTPLADQSL